MDRARSAMAVVRSSRAVAPPMCAWSLARHGPGVLPAAQTPLKRVFQPGWVLFLDLKAKHETQSPVLRSESARWLVDSTSREPEGQPDHARSNCNVNSCPPPRQDLLPFASTPPTSDNDTSCTKRPDASAQLLFPKLPNGPKPFPPAHALPALTMKLLLLPAVWKFHWTPRQIQCELQSAFVEIADLVSSREWQRISRAVSPHLLSFFHERHRHPGFPVSGELEAARLSTQVVAVAVVGDSTAHLRHHGFNVQGKVREIPIVLRIAARISVAEDDSEDEDPDTSSALGSRARRRLEQLAPRVDRCTRHYLWTFEGIIGSVPDTPQGAIDQWDGEDMTLSPSARRAVQLRRGRVDFIVVDALSFSTGGPAAPTLA